MKTTFRLLLILICGLVSCNSRQSTSNEKVEKATIDGKQEIKKLNAFLKKYEETSQTFEISAYKPSKIKGKYGTVISINPFDLVTVNGQPIEKNIIVELKELTNQDQLLRTNAQTISNGKLLISGGAYFINMKSNGNQLKLKEGKVLKVNFPKKSDDEMSVFYGKRDSLEKMNWLDAKQKFISYIPPQQALERLRIDTGEITFTVNNVKTVVGQIANGKKIPLTTKEKELQKIARLSNIVYDIIELNQLGWVNCDRFYEFSNKTNLQFVFKDKDSIVSANIYLIFEDINSVIQCQYFLSNDETVNEGFHDIPVGIKSKLIAVTLKNGKIYAYKSNLTIEPNKTIELDFNETTEDQLDNLFHNN